MPRAAKTSKRFSDKERGGGDNGSFRIPGRPAPARAALALSGVAKIQLKESFQILPPARGVEDFVNLSYPPSTLIEIEFAGGARRYTRADLRAGDFAAVSQAGAGRNQAATAAGEFAAQKVANHSEKSLKSGSFESAVLKKYRPGMEAASTRKKDSIANQPKALPGACRMIVAKNLHCKGLSGSFGL